MKLIKTFASYWLTRFTDPHRTEIDIKKCNYLVDGISCVFFDHEHGQSYEMIIRPVK